MKKLLSVFLVVVVLISVVLLAKDFIIKASVEKGVELVTGLKLNIASLHVGLFKPVARIKNLKLLNPAGFPDKSMIDMPEIYVSYDLPAIIGGKVHLPECRLALKEFVVVKNAKGELNLDALRMVQTKKAVQQPSQKAPGKAPQIKIDLLKLSIGEVIYKDYSKGGEPVVKKYSINLNESYTNITDPYALANLIVVKALSGTSIAGLTGFDLKGMQKEAADALAGAQKEAKDTLNQVSGTLKDVFKNPLGSSK
jgi:uncharacterized protein involved in outer membrane biogenesis